LKLFSGPTVQIQYSNVVLIVRAIDLSMFCFWHFVLQFCLSKYGDMLPTEEGLVDNCEPCPIRGQASRPLRRAFVTF